MIGEEGRTQQQIERTGECDDEATRSEKERGEETTERQAGERESLVKDNNSTESDKGRNRAEAGRYADRKEDSEGDLPNEQKGTGVTQGTEHATSESKTNELLRIEIRLPEGMTLEDPPMVGHASPLRRKVTARAKK